jgi:glycosyltransferase involved in cell wall biosynthesis
MLQVIFTLDYEIHGNGEGCPRELMVEPTRRMLELFDQFGAKLTIMADIGEILKFKQYAEQKKTDDYHYGDIVSQLQDAVARGHDVQLHIHSSYFKATHNGRQWVQHWEEYDFAGLDSDRMSAMVREGREFLESILKPVNPAYRCIAFRAANWSVSPSIKVVRALLDNGIQIDSSIFKHGRRDGLVKFDYAGAHSDLVPWPASNDDLCAQDDRGDLWEFPIYAENRFIGAFLTFSRLCRAAHFRKYGSATAGPARKRTLLDKASFLTKRHAWKADFNQCTGRQLIGALRRADRQASVISDDIPFVLIGHSKLFNSLNERSLRPFLKFVARNKNRFGFRTFGYFQEKIERQDYLAEGNRSGKIEPSYILVTPARNEEATIETTIKSVISQTILPKEWIIVSDRSTDQTDKIVKRYMVAHHFIRLLRIDGKPGHSFAAVVQATEAGMKAVQSKDYSYVGLLDADVRFAPDYYESLMKEFDLDPTLGLAGGLVLDLNDTMDHVRQNLREVAGATQFFKRACFESLGGLLAIPEGGWDAVTCMRARMNGFRTVTFPKLVMDHLKPRNIAKGNWFLRCALWGRRDYVLGGQPLIQMAKCASRWREKPMLLSSLARLCGYSWALLNRVQPYPPPLVLAFHRREQFQRLRKKLIWNHKY